MSTAAEIATKLRRAMITASNDDESNPATDKRTRHAIRIDALAEAIEFLEALPGDTKAPRPDLLDGIRDETWIVRAHRHLAELQASMADMPDLSAVANRQLAEKVAGALAKTEIVDEIHLMLRRLIGRVTL